MIGNLFKLAYQLDKQGKYEIANEIDASIKLFVEENGCNIADIISLADYFDEQGEVKISNTLDNLIKKLAKKTSKRPPKAWFKKMLKDVMKGNPEYSKEQATKTVADIWYHKMTDKQRSKHLKKKK